MVVFGYVRCSTAEQQDSLKVQEDRIRIYCKLKELDEPLIYIDSGVSGSTEFKNRPEAKKIWEQMKANDYVIVLKLDRISRSMSDFVFMMNYFNTQKINFKCLDPDIDTSSSFGKFMMNILGSIAELERSMTIDRVKSTIQKRKEENLCVGRVPYGYSKTEDKKLVVNEKEQNIIKHIKLMAKEGLNMNAIAYKLNVLNVSDKKWYPQHIKRILES